MVECQSLQLTLVRPNFDTTHEILQTIRNPSSGKLWDSTDNQESKFRQIMRFYRQSRYQVQANYEILQTIKIPSSGKLWDSTDNQESKFRQIMRFYRQSRYQVQANYEILQTIKNPSSGNLWDSTDNQESKFRQIMRFCTESHNLDSWLSVESHNLPKLGFLIVYRIS